jgi:microcystin-dependent protein
MAEPFLGEIRMYGFNFPPSGWATCDGQLMGIAQNQALYSLLGTIYGGNGSTNFALPDLRGRTMLHRSASRTQGQMSGLENTQLGTANLPAHSHALQATTAGATVNTAQGNALGTSETGFPNYSDLSTAATMNTASLATAGSGTAHSNMQPSLVINFCIALTGIYPTRN